MAFVTVFRRIPAPIIGLVGTRYDASFERFEADLDWLETTGAAVERFDPDSVPAVRVPPAVRQLLDRDGDRSLPLVLVGDTIVSRGAYLSRAQLARAVGRGDATRSAA